jgi:putative chitinase
MASLDARNDNPELLHPALRMRVDRLIDRLAEEQLPFRLFEGFRSPQRQAFLFKKRPRVTKAGPWSSYHQYGLAVDFVLFINDEWSWRTDGKWARAWDELHRLADEVDLEPLSFEKPHLQLKGITIDELRRGEYPVGGHMSWADNLEAAVIAWRGEPASPPPPVTSALRPPVASSGEADALDHDARDETPVHTGRRDRSPPIDRAAMRDLFPDAEPGVLEALLSSSDTLQAHGILASSRRLAFFLAQIAHESGGLSRVEENLSYSAERAAEVFPKHFASVTSAVPFARAPEQLANKVYADRLGNGPPESDDGWRYRGRGLIQITGRNNYRDVGSAIGIDLEAAPDLAASARHVVDVACGYWSSNDLNRFADRDDFLGLTRKINGGENGLADRRAWLRRIATAIQKLDVDLERPMAMPSAMDAFPPTTISKVMDMEELAFCDQGERVKALQAALTEAGYPVGDHDGKFGRLTRGAVLQLQADHGRPLTGRVGVETWALLDSGATRPLEKKRKEASGAELAQKGSVTVQNADSVRLVGLLSTILGALGLGNSLVTGAAQVPPSTVSVITGLPRPITEICARLAQLPEADRAAMQLFCSAPAGSGMPARTILDFLPRLFADPGAQNLSAGLASVAASIVPGAGGSLLAVGLGLAARHFGNKIVAARVKDHQTAANIRI